MQQAATDSRHIFFEFNASDIRGNKNYAENQNGRPANNRKQSYRTNCGDC